MFVRRGATGDGGKLTGPCMGNVHTAETKGEFTTVMIMASVREPYCLLALCAVGRDSSVVIACD